MSKDVSTQDRDAFAVVLLVMMFAATLLGIFLGVKEWFWPVADQKAHKLTAINLSAGHPVDTSTQLPRNSKLTVSSTVF
jgi:hypothetical protein